MIEDEEFFAWLDGELEDEAADRVAAEVAASPELTARAASHRALVGQLRGAFEPVIAAGIPAPRFETTEPVDLGARRWRRSFGLPQWAAMAATLAIGFVAGQFVGDRSGAPIESSGGRLVASASLDHALDTRLASAPAANGPRIGLTFRDSSGNVCRSFTDAGTSGLACRHDGQWRIRGLFQGAEGQTGDYRMAAGADPQLAALIDSTIAGEPFDAAQEKAAFGRNWR